MTGTIAVRRLASLAITRPEPDPAAVVRRLLAVQAQDLGQARWAVGLRCGATAAQVDAALASGEIVRTWSMRGTLHLVPAADVRWMLALLAARTVAAAGRRLGELGLDEVTVERCGDHLEGRLSSATRGELLAEIEAFGVSTAGQRGYHLLGQLAQRGRIVLLGDRFVPLASVAPPVPFDREAALVELARRYFRGHGPATAADLARWANLPLRDVRVGIDGAGLDRETIDGVDHWSDDAEEPPPPGVHLLPGFDELMLGYKDRSATIAAADEPRVCPGGNGVFRPTVVVDGRMVATWRAIVARRGVSFTWEPFAGSLDEDALAEPRRRYVAFLG